jgi:hypothetical protein
MIPTQWCQLGTPPGASSASILGTAWLQKVQGQKMMSAGYNLLCPTPCMHQAVLRYPSFRRLRDVSALVSWLQVHYISKRLLTLDLGISLARHVGWKYHGNMEVYLCRKSRKATAMESVATVHREENVGTIASISTQTRICIGPRPERPSG